MFLGAAEGTQIWGGSMYMLLLRLNQQPGDGIRVSSCSSGLCPRSTLLLMSPRHLVPSLTTCRQSGPAAPGAPGSGKGFPEHGRDESPGPSGHAGQSAGHPGWQGAGRPSAGAGTVGSDC